MLKDAKEICDAILAGCFRELHLKLKPEIARLCLHMFDKLTNVDDQGRKYIAWAMEGIWLPKAL